MSLPTKKKSLTAAAAAAIAALASLEIFRAGRHTDAGGNEVEFRESDLDGIVSSYDPNIHEAPIVVGHPKTDDPAYGWVKSVKRKGTSLEITTKDVDPAFAEMVKAGRFKKRSASFYLPDSPNNPTPGTYALKHVGFLGAAPPSVKGLRPIEFSEDEQIVTFEVAFAEGDAAKDPKKVDPKEGEGEGEAPKAPSSDALFEAIASLLPPETTEEQKTQMKDALASLLNPKPKEDPAFSERERGIAKRERELAKREAAALRETHLSFVESIIKDGRPMPGMKEKIVNLLTALDAVPSGTISFGEGDTRSPSTVFKEDFLARLPKQVLFAEITGSTTTVEIDLEDPRVVGRLAAEFRESKKKEGVFMTTSEAVRAVRRGEASK